MHYALLLSRCRFTITYLIPIYLCLLVRLFPLDDLAAHDVVREERRRLEVTASFRTEELFENQRSIASRSYVCPSEAITGSCMSSWVIGQRYSSGGSTGAFA